MLNGNNPLAEVFGFKVDNFSARANRYRQQRLCPFSNKVPNCTKDKAKDPLGVCSIHHGDDVVITCPIRFRQEWIVAEHAASFFFPNGTPWTTLSEVRMNDRHGNSAGNVDIVLVAYDDDGQIVDFGALEIQAVYISGNVRSPFTAYMIDPQQNVGMDWRSSAPYYPRPDFLSSSRKRLVPQLIYKGSILKSWGKRQAVAVDRAFYRTMTTLPTVEAHEADLAWFIYELQHDPQHNLFELTLTETVFTQFRPALDAITTPEVGPVEEFLAVLQGKLDEQMSARTTPPDAPSLADILSNGED